VKERAVDRNEAAERIGMRPTEVLDVQELGEGHVVTTHDGQRVQITADGTVEPYDQEHAPQAWAREIGDNAAAAEASGEPIRPEMTERDVPTGDLEEVLAWVGTDPRRAALALQVESQRGDARADLLEMLETLNSDGDGEVPSGSAQRVLDWVGANQDRARQALEIERAKVSPRRQLVTALEKVERAE